MKKKLLYVGLATLAFLNFSCDSDDKDADDVVPAMELTMERSFMYHDTHETKNASYTTEDFQSGISNEDGKLIIFLSAEPDAVSFEIEEANLQDGKVGIYTLKSLPNPETGKAETTYLYNNNDGSGSAYFSEGNFMSGSVKITDYDEKHNLISGTFELTMEDVPDPTITSPTPTPKRCDVTVTGTFENAKLTTNP